MAFYIQNPGPFVGSSLNQTQLFYDASRCGANEETCLDLFRYDSVTPANNVLRIFVTATDGGGLVSTGVYTINILNTPDIPVWVNLPAEIDIVEGTTGPTQIYPMEAFVPNYVAALNTVTYLMLSVNPPVDASTGLTYITFTQGGCTPAPPTILQCAALELTNNVVAGTLNYTKHQQYNVTMWLTNEVVGSSVIYTISVNFQ